MSNQFIGEPEKLLIFSGQKRWILLPERVRLLCHNFARTICHYVCVRIGKIDRLRSPLNA